MQWLRIHISDILLLIVTFTPQSVDVSATEEQDAGPREGEQEAGPREGEQDARPREGEQEAGPREGEQDAGPREGEQEAGPREGEQEAYPPSQVILYWYLSTSSSTVPTRYMVGHC